MPYMHWMKERDQSHLKFPLWGLCIFVGSNALESAANPAALRQTNHPPADQPAPANRALRLPRRSQSANFARFTGTEQSLTVVPVATVVTAMRQMLVLTKRTIDTVVRDATIRAIESTSDLYP